MTFTTREMALDNHLQTLGGKKKPSEKKTCASQIWEAKSQVRGSKKEDFFEKQPDLHLPGQGFSSSKCPSHFQ